MRLALQTLRANPLRTALSTLGIIMGAASLAAVLSIGDGVEAFARHRLEQEGMQVVVITPKTADVIDGQRIPRQDVAALATSDVSAIAASVGDGFGVTLSRRGTVRWQATADGPLRAAALVGRLEAGAVRAPTLAAGRTLQPAEMRSNRPVALASYALAEALGIPAVKAVGSRILAAGQPVEIVGVLEKPPGRATLELTVPDGLAQSMNVPSRDPQPPFITVHAPTIDAVPALRGRLERWAKAAYGDRLTVASRGLDTLRDMAQAILIFKLMMGAFTAISLIVGGIGIMNVLLASVIERTREIGVRKAIGARQRDVVLQFLTESVAIALAGSLAGLVVGMCGAFAAAAIIRARTQSLLYAAMSWETVAVSLAAATITGIVFGLYPALRASRLSPVDAMRYE